MAEHAKIRKNQVLPRALSRRAGRKWRVDYLDALNPEQRLAVETLDGPVLVLAGAGTGKTRVLTTRIAHILNLGKAHPSQILAVTFTNKAAREMKHRIGDMVGQVVEGMPWLGTFHAIGVKILRRHAELVGLKSNFTILDVDDQIRLIKQLLEVANIDEKRWPARVFAGILDGWKNRGLTPDQVPAGEAMAFANGKGKELYAAFQAAAEDPERLRLRRSSAGAIAPVPRTSRRARRLSAPLPLYSGRRVSGHERRAISVAATARPIDFATARARRLGGRHTWCRADQTATRKGDAQHLLRRR